MCDHIEKLPHTFRWTKHLDFWVFAEQVEQYVIGIASCIRSTPLKKAQAMNKNKNVQSLEI